MTESPKNEWINWAITLKSTNKLIGLICFWNISKEHSKAEIGYELMANYQGKGIMQEALTTVVEHGFANMKLHLIEAFPNQNNSNDKTIGKKRFY
jgi:[ribosomal protein S5]-alanine N-acetyltransferase